MVEISAQIMFSFAPLRLCDKNLVRTKNLEPLHLCNSEPFSLLLHQIN